MSTNYPHSSYNNIISWTTSLMVNKVSNSYVTEIMNLEGHPSANTAADPGRVDGMASHPL